MKKLENYNFLQLRYLTNKLWPKVYTILGKWLQEAAPRGKTSWALQITAGFKGSALSSHL